MRNYILLCLLFGTITLFGQGPTTTWVVHNAIQLDFVGDSVIITHKNNQWFTHMPMANASICDSIGNFLFATNAECVLNANNDTMPNGILMGNKNSGQTIIVPKPSNPNRYYIFTTGKYYSMTDFRYSEVDMTLDAALGGIIPSQSNILLQSDITDRVTAVKHANGKDVWVVTHENNNKSFKAYLVTENGIQTPAITSNIGTILQDTAPFDLFDAACNGNIKCSPCGRRIAISSKGLNLVELYNFDNETGLLSNPISYNIPLPYFLEFSGDANMLYCSTEYSWNIVDDTIRIYQIDILNTDITNTSAAIFRVNNTQLVAPPDYRASLQLGTDGKIYVPYKFSSVVPFLGTINFPHLTNSNCDFVYNQQQLPSTTYGSHINNVPNFMTSYFDKNVFATTACFGDSTMIHTLNSELFDSIRWEINDPLTGLHVYHNQDTVYHIYSQAGQYTVHCYRYRGQYIDDFKKNLQVIPYAQAMLLDTNLCIGEQVQLSFTGNFGTNVYWYRQLPNWTNWELIDSGQVVTVTEEAYYYPKIDFWDVCGDKPDTAFVNVVDINLDLGADTLSGNCITNKYWLAPQWNLSEIDFWQWNTGSFNFLLQPDSSGIYSLYASGSGCEEEDSVYVIYDEPLDIYLGTDLQLCDDSAWLEINAPSDDYFWMPNGETTKGIFANQSNQYIGNAVNACGAYSDTIVVLIGETPPEFSSLDTAICAGDSLLTDPPILEATYEWSTGDTVPNIYLHHAGSYNLTISNFCGSSVMDIELNIDSLLELSLVDTLWLNSGDSTIIDPAIDATSYFWSTGASDPFIWVSDSGLYSVTITNACGSLSDSVVVLSTLPISNIEELGFSFYPNPSSNSIFVEVDSRHIGASLSIHSILGKQVISQKLQKVKNEIYLRALPPGNYYLRIKSGDLVITHKLIKI